VSGNIYQRGRGGQGGRRVWALRKRRGTLPNQTEYWTIHGDFTRDVEDARQFASNAEADAWLKRNENAHLRGMVRITQVWTREVRSS
jgi:hypothetical protein